MKKMKKLLALLVAIVMCVSVVGVIPAKAATTLENNGINWFAGQNGNPWSGSKWTFQTGKDGNFTKMTNFIAKENSINFLKSTTHTIYLLTQKTQNTV